MRNLLAAGLLATAMLAAAWALSPSHGPSRLELGVHGATWTTRGVSTPAEQQRYIDMLERSGAKWVRLIVHWSLMERAGKGVYNEPEFARLEAQIRAARQAGVDILLVGSPGTPYWAASGPTVQYKPKDVGDYADFMRYLVSRTGPLGVHHYELWNEPDHQNGYWKPAPNAAEYTSLLRAAYPAVKQADPEAVVLLGGLVQSNADYLQQVYRAGGEPFFDAVGNHMYPQAGPKVCRVVNGRKSPQNVCGIEELRKVMVANGDADKDIWVTELGWTTCACPPPVYHVTSRQQADYLVQAYRKLASYPYVKAAFWFSLSDLSNDPARLESGFGLLNPDYSAKAAYAAFRGYAH